MKYDIRGPDVVENRNAVSWRHRIIIKISLLAMTNLFRNTQTTKKL